MAKIPSNYLDPITKFKNWYQEELEKSTNSIPSACCFSTLGLDGYPNARFVSMKEVIEDKFVITGPLDSRKGQEFEACSKAAITFWWTATERQIRIQGDLTILENNLADNYFKERNNLAKIVSTISDQGKELDNLEDLQNEFATQRILAGNNASIQRPKRWGGFYLHPKRIELMEFRKSRFHLRELYTKKDASWQLQFLQP